MKTKYYSYLLIFFLFVLYLFYHDFRAWSGQVLKDWLLVENSVWDFWENFLGKNFYKKIPLAIWLGYAIYAFLVIGLTVAAVYLHFQNTLYAKISFILMVTLLFVCGVLSFLFVYLEFPIADRICRETIYYVISPVSIMFFLPTFMLLEKQKNKTQLN
ncbi:MAG: hypothetical protein NZM38_07975 [Cytophagales bacterium]|nr:hypothetical protein [Cytophagales bacterium]MDW8384695.1 hypothetical protein [Flammeovirgaceae bacterium]